jgi:hypothetical protein
MSPLLGHRSSLWITHPQGERAITHHAGPVRIGGSSESAYLMRTNNDGFLVHQIALVRLFLTIYKYKIYLCLIS